MEGKSLKEGARYLMRVRGKQVPVRFEARVTAFGKGFDGIEAGTTRLMFVRLDDGTVVYKKRAGALSKHYDDCAHLRAWTFPCECAKRLKEASRG